jgi:predicted ester cyclase
MWWSAFDTEVVGERLHLAENSAVAETTWKGAHRGEFMGIAATGRPVEFTVAVVVDFRDGRMSGERFYWDGARLARQLGAEAMRAADTKASSR